jgi:hypothetical protein
MPNAVTDVVIVDPAEHAAVRDAMIEFDRMVNQAHPGHPVEQLDLSDYLKLISLNSNVDEDTVMDLVPIIVLEFAARQNARRAMH